VNRRDVLKGAIAAALVPAALVEDPLPVIFGTPPAGIPLGQWAALNRLRDYEFAEFQAATVRAIAAAMFVSPAALTREYSAGYSSAFEAHKNSRTGIVPSPSRSTVTSWERSLSDLGGRSR